MLSKEAKLILSFIVCLIAILAEQFIFKLNPTAIIIATATFLILQIIKYFKEDNSN